MILLFKPWIKAEILRLPYLILNPLRWCTEAKLQHKMCHCPKILCNWLYNHFCLSFSHIHKLCQLQVLVLMITLKHSSEQKQKDHFAFLIFIVYKTIMTCNRPLTYLSLVFMSTSTRVHAFMEGEKTSKERKEQFLKHSN